MPSNPEKRAQQQRERRAARKEGAKPHAEAPEAPKPPVAIVAPPPPAVPQGGSEWHARLRLEVAKTSTRQVGRLLGTSHTMVSKYVNGWTLPGSEVLEAARLAYDMAPELLSEPERPPPPPKTLDEQREDLVLDGTFLDFVMHGPLPLVLSAAQRAVVKVCFDDMEPEQLTDEERATCDQLLGASLDRIPPQARRRVLLRLGRRAFKTTIAALYIVFRSCTCDLAKVGRHEEAVALCFTSRLKTTKTVYSMCREILRMMPLKALIDSDEEFSFQRPDGRNIRVCATVKSAGGLSMRSRWIAVVYIDESEYSGTQKSDAVILDDDQIAAILPTLLPGAKIVCGSTIGSPTSWAARAFEDNYKSPTNAIAMKGPTLLMRPDDEHLRAERQSLLNGSAIDRAIALRDFDLEDEQPEGTLVPRELARACIPFQTWRTPTRQMGSGGVDMSSSGDWAACVTLERQGHQVVVTGIDVEIPPERGVLEPLSLAQRFVWFCRGLEVRYVVADTYEAATLRSVAIQNGVVVMVEAHPEQLAINLRDLVLSRRLVIPSTLRHAEELVYQLSMIGAKEVRGGVVSKKSRIRGHGHMDVYAALECAAWADRLQYGPLPETPLDPLGFGASPSQPDYTPAPYFGFGRGGFEPNGTNTPQAIPSSYAHRLGIGGIK